MTEDDPHYMVHVTHCCTSSCKYMDDDCPVATGQVLPKYRCEDCTCFKMNPEKLPDALSWWAALSDAQKVQVFLQQSQWSQW